MADCRIITFINYHIPMAKDINSKDIQYITMGFFDGMITEKINLHNKKQENTKEFIKLWEYELHRTSECKGKYSYQNIACFEHGKDSKYSDEEIWKAKTDKKYPLTFITFLQLEDYVQGKNALDEQCLKFDNAIEQIITNGEYYTYKTVDKNDFVICIKCRNYANAVKAIKQLHRIDNCNIIYSYTVFSISIKVLGSFNETDYQDIYNETINSICLKGITNNYCKNPTITLDDKYRKFGCDLLTKIYAGETNKNSPDAKIYDILGDNDFRLIARDVKLGKIINEFSNGGMLNYYEKTFSSYLFSSSLLLNTTENNIYENKNISNSSILIDTNREYTTPHCDELENNMSWISDVVKQKKGKNEPYWETIAAMCNGIWQLLQSLKALERPKTKKYDFLSIFIPLKQMVNILEDKIATGNRNQILENRNNIFDFLHKISMALHGTLRTDIQFFQIRDFNAVIHYAPAKLRAFYSLWALQLSDYYSLFCDSNTEKTYSFILSSGMFPEVNVKQLFDNDEDIHRLMLISLPERQLYTVKKLSIMLGHEVSHFVGTDVKCRYERYICLIKMVTRILTLEINYLRYVKTSVEHQNEIEKIIADSKLYERLKLLLLEENALFEKEHKLPDILHSEITILCIMELFDLFIKKYTEIIVGEDCEYYYQSFLKTHLKKEKKHQNKANILNNANSISYNIETYVLKIIQKYSGNLDSFLGQILYEVLREACADISSILTLELTPNEYIESFCNLKIPSNTQEYHEEITPKEIRIVLVIKGIQQGIIGKKDYFINNSFVNDWNLFRIEDFVKNHPIGSEAEVLGCKLFLCFENKKDKNTCIRNYKSAYNYNKEYFTGDILDFYNDIEIWNEMSYYINSCINEYLQKLSDTNNAARKTLLEKKRHLTSTYKDIASGSIGTQLQTIENFLASYEMDSLSH